MSYFPCDIPYMSEEELIENGIKIHRDASQIICNKCKHYQGVRNVQGHAPCDYWKSGSVLWNEYCSKAEPYREGE